MAFCDEWKLQKYQHHNHDLVVTVELLYISILQRGKKLTETSVKSHLDFNV